jgi:hypothetical protein
MTDTDLVARLLALPGETELWSSKRRATALGWTI